jgi:hypothetical protein
MTSLNRVLITWSGPQVVGGGVTVLHYAGDVGAPPIAGIKSAFSSAAKLIPGGVTLTIPGSGDVINDANGELTGVWSATGGGTVAGTGSAQCAAGVGAVISWQTGLIWHGRKVRGRTFIVPIAFKDPGSGDEAFDNDGTFGSATLVKIQTLANNLQATGPLAVWSRPTSKGASDGSSGGVVSNRVPDRVSTLRSRRI